jgi:hypothetical protein
MNARKSLLTKALLSAGAFAVLAGSAGTAVASAHTVAPVTTVTHLINRNDGGGNGTWAYDTFTRTMTLNYLGKSTDPAHAAAPYEYNAVVSDQGTFKTIPGAFTPDQGGRDLGRHIRPTQENGTMTGFGQWGVFYSSVKANSPRSFYDSGVPIRLSGGQNLAYPSSTWPTLAFPATATIQGLNEAGYGYGYTVPAHVVNHRVIKAQTWNDTAWNGDGQIAPGDGNIS